ncbi:MAG TPA: hypothetical protein P5075_04450 [Eubacteriales bacterium]|nr:hypothetical protein [Eubacteriales bacterium]
MRTFRTIFAHLSIMFSGVFITLVILHLYNPSMGFLTSDVSLIYILCFCATVTALSIATVAEQRRHARLARKHAEEAAHQQKAESVRRHLPGR